MDKRLIADEELSTAELRIESLIEEGDKRAFSNPTRLQEIAEELHQLSGQYTNRRGLIYSEYFLARVLYKQSEFEQALPRYVSALESFEEINDEVGIRNSLRQIGLAYQMLCRYSESLEYYNRELDIRKTRSADNKIGIAGVLANIATIYLLIGKSDIALQYYLESLDTLKHCNDDYVLLNVLGNTANLYMSLGEYRQAMRYFQKVLVLCRRIGDKSSEGHTLLNMGWNYFQRGEYKLALDCNQLALVLFKEIGERKRSAIVLLHIGQIYVQLRQYENALPFFEQSSEISHEIGDKRNCLSILRAMGDMYAVTDNPVKAKEYYIDALSIARDVGLRQDEYDICSLLAIVEEQQGNARDALRYFREYMRIKEEVLDERRRQAISEMQVKFNAEQTEKEKEIYRLKNVELAGALEEVEKLNVHLSDMDSEKNEMLGIVAHDLRSPLSGVRLVCSMLREHHQRMSSSELVAQLDEVVASTGQMLRIVNSLLDVQAIESGEVYGENQLLDIRAVLGSVEKRYREEGLLKGICLEVEYGVEHVYGHAEGLQQVVGNLLSNAIKFSRAGSCVYLNVKRSAGEAELCVRDSGVGISETEQARLFRKFSRVGSVPTGGESSTGLGLWIVKKLAEGMGGRVECESTAGKGSTFRVLFPMLPLSTLEAP